jgi:MutS domain V
MKAHLLYRDADLDLDRPLPPNEAALSQDLELGVLLQAMARGDEFLREVARSVLHASLTAAEDIRYRQDILSDCLRHPTPVLQMYGLASEAVKAERGIYRDMFSNPAYILHRSVEALQLFDGVLRQFRRIADEQAASFTSAGFAKFFRVLRNELDDAYFEEVQQHIRKLRFRDGMLVSARLGAANAGTGYVLCSPPAGRPGILGRLPGQGRIPGYLLTVADRDVSGHRTLSHLRDKGLNQVADALAQSAEHIRNFLAMLRRELAFYVGCLHLHDQLTRQGEPLCIPLPLPAGKLALSGRGLYDPCLALSLQRRVVGNDVDADGKALVMITGANQGGKSTFLRSIGLAQLMMQCGMFVPAQAFSANVCSGVFTHFKRAEDAGMVSGKLDEELGRMREITDMIARGGLLLCNESFAATNEREGSHIARNIVQAMLDSDIKVVFVTHFYDLAHGFHAEGPVEALFLRAERAADGTRTFRLNEDGPLLTSHAQDIYEQIFGGSPSAAQSQG